MGYELGRKEAAKAMLSKIYDASYTENLSIEKIQKLKDKIRDFYNIDDVIKEVVTSSKCGCELLFLLICNLLDISHDDFTFNIKSDNETDIVFKSDVLTVNLDMNIRCDKWENNSFICQIVLTKKEKVTTDYKNKCNKFYQININNYAVADDDRYIVRNCILDVENYVETYSCFEILDINLAKILKKDYTSIRKGKHPWIFLLYFLRFDNINDLEKIYKNEKNMAEVVNNIKAKVDDFNKL